MTATPTAEDQGTVEDVTVRVCGAPSRYVILTEEPFSEDRWCFHCRGRHGASAASPTRTGRASPAALTPRP